jgi:hypothetical protein
MLKNAFFEGKIVRGNAYIAPMANKAYPLPPSRRAKRL